MVLSKYFSKTQEYRFVMKAKAISEKLTGLQQAIQSLKDPNAEQVVNTTATLEYLNFELL
jgi:hypothetical protein